jgi:membrane protease YdiL (CAAX protease family)
MSTDPDDDAPDEPLDDRSARNMVVGLAIAIEGGLVALAWLVGWLLDHRPLERFAFSLWAVLWGLAAVVPMLAGFFAAVRWPVGPLRGIKDFTDRVIRPLMYPCSLIDLAGIALLAGLGEEMLFRGVLQEAFHGWLSGWDVLLDQPVLAAVLAVAGAALLFGILHAVTPAYAVLAAVVGAYLGCLYLLTGNLMAPIVAHALYDFVALVYLTRGPGSDLPPEPEEGAQEEERPGD